MSIDKHRVRGQCINYTATVRRHARAFHTIYWFATGKDWFIPNNETKAENMLTKFYFRMVMK